MSERDKDELGTAGEWDPLATAALILISNSRFCGEGFRMVVVLTACMAIGFLGGLLGIWGDD